MIKELIARVIIQIVSNVITWLVQRIWVAFRYRMNHYMRRGWKRTEPLRKPKRKERPRRCKSVRREGADFTQDRENKLLFHKYIN